MKYCSTCGEKYSDRVDFCFADGAVLGSGVADSASSFVADTFDDDVPMPGNLKLGAPSDHPQPIPDTDVVALAFTPVPANSRAAAPKGFTSPPPVEAEPKKPASTDDTQPIKAPLTAKELASAATAPPPIRTEGGPERPVVDREIVGTDAGDSSSTGNRTLIVVGAAMATLGVGAVVVMVGMFGFAGFMIGSSTDQPETTVASASTKTNATEEATIKEPTEPLDEVATTERTADADSVDDAANVDADNPVDGVAALDVEDEGTPPAANPSSEAESGEQETVSGGGDIQPVAVVPVPPKGPAEPASSPSPVIETPEVKPDEPAVAVVDEPATEPAVEIAPVKPEPKPEPRKVNVLLVSSSVGGSAAKLTVDGKDRGNGARWPLRLELTEGEHVFVVGEGADAKTHTKTVRYQSSMVIVNLD